MYQVFEIGGFEGAMRTGSLKECEEYVKNNTNVVGNYFPFEIKSLNK